MARLSGIGLLADDLYLMAPPEGPPLPQQGSGAARSRPA